MKLKALVGAAALTAGLLTVPVAASTAASATPANHTCTGSLQTPGSLSGTYSNVLVVGACMTTAPTHVLGNLTVAPGGVVVAAFHGAPLTVNGSVTVGRGGSAILGCFATSFACLDDPNQAMPTLNGPVHIGGSYTAFAPLGVVNHDMTLGGSETVAGGGGGVNCNPQGVFNLFGSPAYTDNEDSTVYGNVTISGLQTCWMGLLRVHIGGSATDTHNTFADPDANEVHNNVVNGNLVCLANSPKVQYGDAGNGAPNRVRGIAVGECGFNVRLPNPAPNGPLTPISVRG